MSDNLLLLGGTDVTLAVAEAAMGCGVALAGIVAVGESFSISYSETRIKNARSVDLQDWTQRHGVPLIPFTTYDDVLTHFSGGVPPLCVVAGWYHMVPRRVRELFARGCYGFHASLLPQLRGGAPLNWAILSGMAETGVTLFEMADGVDDGLVFGQERFRIGPRATIAELAAEARRACATLTQRHLPALMAGTAQGTAQEGVPSYGLQRIPEDGAINWSAGAVTIDRMVRAVGRPYPGAFTRLGDTAIRIWAADIPMPQPQVFGAPGQITKLREIAEPCVVTGDGLLRIVEASDEAGSDQLDNLLRSAHKRFDS
ncbi:MAG: methionyl-tRNA formyltransferase [Hyphomicrobiales bacterium]|nr:MAG: methionyl-tRNA formyltransferase [Hyphomicrobiales bacterium]